MSNRKKILQALMVIPFFLIAVFLGFQALNAKEVKPLPESQQHLLGHVNWQQERDYIGLMAAFSVVYQDWQTAEEHPRGYNIGCVLVDNLGDPVFWARNAVNAVNNKTQHGEVRTIMGYSFQYNLKDLNGFSLYGTLEPCAQCSGMAAMMGIERVVWGQDDREYGGTLARLNGDKNRISPCVTITLDTAYCWEQPFPKTTHFTQPIQNPAFWDNFGEELEEGYQEYATEHECDPKKGCMVDYLYDESVKALYKKVYDAFKSYQVQFTSKNQNFYEDCDTMVVISKNQKNRRLCVCF